MFTLPIVNPTLSFLVVLLVILLAPIVMGKLRIPHIIGMVLAGAALGQFGFNVLERDDSFQLFGNVGLYYIMFLAALEMDLEGLRRRKQSVTLFGFISFIIPFLLTWLVCQTVLGYSLTTSLLLGSIMSSNTLVAYPIVRRFNLQHKPSVLLSVGGTMISLMLALISLAVIESLNKGETDWWFWPLFAVKFFVYGAAMTLIIPRLARYFLRKYSDAVMQFIFVLAMMFMSAFFSDMVGLEGIFGAFVAGVIMNRYIPALSPLMNRLEFTGNALFIPYFLIGVGMLINVRVLFTDTNILWVVLALVLIGTLGKGIAAYAASFIERLPLSSGHMIFGLTSAHAAGAIAMMLVGLDMTLSDGSPVINDTILNSVVAMILFTCIISSLITEQSALTITLRDRELAKDETPDQDDEKIIIPVKYPEYAEQLVTMGMLMRNPKLHRELVALNVVYDDQKMRRNQEEGQKLLKQVVRVASAADVPITTQVRIAANIANGIKHAFKEFNASEVLLGMHMHKDVSNNFWGQFHQSLFNGLNRQIMMARLHQPLNTIRRIQVAVPSRAQYESGFYRWVERLSRLAENLECRILFHGRLDTLEFLQQYIRNNHPDMRVDYEEMEHWNELPHLASTISEDHLFVVVTARKGTISYKNAQERLPAEIKKYFKGKNLLIIFPDQYGDLDQNMTFAQSQHTEDRSAYEVIRDWINQE